MKKSLGLLLLTLTIPMISGCKGGVASVTPPSSLNEVLDNMSSFGMYFGGGDQKTYMEINSDNCYYYGPSSYGYTVLDSDPNYMHFFSITNTGAAIFEMEMNGRVGSIDDLHSLRERAISFKTLIATYGKLFEKVNDYKYVYNGNKLGLKFKEYFQLNSFNFCNYYEINIAKNGRMESFLAGEYYEDTYEAPTYTVNAHFDNGDIKETYFYKDWDNKGKNVRERIFDYKSFTQNARGYVSCYNEGEITGIVTSVDYDGTFYISNNEKYNGSLGMNVLPKSPVSVSIGDKVNVKGNIVMDAAGKHRMSPKFINTQVNVLSHDNPVPFFSEESIVDSYAPGIYCAGRFISSPMYADSLYSGYAYIGDIPVSANPNGETVVTYYCPDFVDNSNNVFKGKIHFPKEYGISNIENALEELRSLGDYSINKEETKASYIQNVIVSFAISGQSSTIDLYVQNHSIISHRLSFQESIEQDYGLTDFPVPQGENAGHFHFGTVSDWYIETTYALPTDNAITGMFYFSNRTNIEYVNAYMNALTEYGAVLYNAFGEYYSNDLVHYVYTYKDNIVIDLMFDEMVNGTCSKLQLYVYRNEKVIRYKTIDEKIDEACNPYFKGSEFIKLDNTFDKNYRFYRLNSYAGNTFSKDNFLTLVTLDLKENRYDELRKAYRDAGWKQYRNADSTAFSYSTRGNTRIVYYKENSNGNKTFIDFGLYPTTDYTFSGHAKFTDRIEMAIYEGQEPIKTQYTQSLDVLIDDALMGKEVGGFSWTLPSKYKAELYCKNYDEYYADFGYDFTTNAFIYPETRNEENLKELLQYVKDTFESHGYVLIFESKRGFNYGYPRAGAEKVYDVYVYFMLDLSRGFVRVIGSVGGADF